MSVSYRFRIVAKKFIKEEREALEQITRNGVCPEELPSLSDRYKEIIYLEKMIFTITDPEEEDEYLDNSLASSGEYSSEEPDTKRKRGLRE